MGAGSHRFEWRGDSSGKIVFAVPSQHEARNGHELTHILYSHSDKFTEEELETLGSCTFYMALRESRMATRASGFQVAAKVLDSYDMIREDAKFEAFQRGITRIQEELFHRRGEPARDLLAEAFASMQHILGIRE